MTALDPVAAHVYGDLAEQPSTVLELERSLKLAHLYRPGACAAALARLQRDGHVVSVQLPDGRGLWAPTDGCGDLR